MASYRKFALTLVSIISLVSCSAKDASTYPTSSASYMEVDSEVGCESKYSDEKKKDVFNSQYKDRLMTWSGEVILAEADNVSLNIDGKGIQDLQVEFSDKNAGYSLTKGKTITVKFVMKNAGGCFLPFNGQQATIL